MRDDLGDYNAMLERFRAKHRELEEAGQRVRLYALLDQGGLTSQERRSLGDPEEPHGVSLYAGSGLDSLEAVGPVLLEMPDVCSIEPLTYTSLSGDDSTAGRFVRLLSLAWRNAARVTWIWTPHDADALVEHLQTLLHAHLEADDDAWFFFYYPSHLNVLYEQLPAATRQYVFGPVHAWWMLDVHGELVELQGECAQVPHAWDVLPIPADVAVALQRAAMPAQVYAWLKQARLGPIDGECYNEQLAQITPLVERAQEVYGLSRLMDLATFVAYGLRYQVDYDLHPEVAAALADTATQGGPLASAYRRVKAGAWRELAQSAPQRVQA
ncbi:hypothetical protein HDG34_003158 [Paraburkholderia sp. HC6.4b]|uniref:DUF4123 domain-containing protein n=1 Tax=unclassified Paraburkholderia TaxID=2615204 RepID=UPI00161C767E|nr:MULTISPECIES: DUF4123 domain-containing protein [unclassified Paraburkholderia]MBB5409217.1 hypothetical protein [Paraburkholderia sp. HC6.4b]MBB5450945.1 hypothetical protein [Paraburkholderia sp. Kb1A]